MNFSSDFFSNLNKQLKQVLPGESAQKKLSAHPDYTIKGLLQKNPNPRQSAVMIVLWPENNGVRCLLIRRSDSASAHGGQMAFPGGKWDELDTDLIQTAIRETREEIGLGLDTQSVIGALSPLYIPVSNFLVNPFVASCGMRPLLSIEPAEVQDVVDFDLGHILNDQNIHIGERLLQNGAKLKTPYYEIEGFEVWGATAMILSELAEVLRIISS